jgi:hypothetical protein
VRGNANTAAKKGAAIESNKAASVSSMGHSRIVNDAAKTGATNKSYNAESVSSMGRE